MLKAIYKLILVIQCLVISYFGLQFEFWVIGLNLFQMTTEIYPIFFNAAVMWVLLIVDWIVTLYALLK